MNSQNASDEDFPSFMEKSRAIHKELQEVLGAGSFTKILLNADFAE